MTQKRKNPAVQGGVRCASDWRHSPDNNLPDNEMQCAPGSDGAIAGSLDPQAIRVELSERERERGDRVPVADKLDPSIRRLSTDKDGEVIAGPRFEYMVEHLHRLGRRPLAELLIEIARSTGQPAVIADRVEAYSRLDPERVRTIGADKFPPMPLEVVR